MEYHELQHIWNEYENRLNKLENINKELVLKSLHPKPKRKQNFFKYKSIQSIIAYPIALAFLFLPQFCAGYIDWIMITGYVFVFAVLIYLGYVNIITYKALNSLNIIKDNVLESSRKMTRIKKTYSLRYRNSLYSLPLLYLGIVLVKYRIIFSDTRLIIFVVVLFLALFAYNLTGPKLHRKFISDWEKDIADFNEYK